MQDTSTTNNKFMIYSIEYLSYLLFVVLGKEPVIYIITGSFL